MLLAKTVKVNSLTKRITDDNNYSYSLKNETTKR